MIQPNLIPVHYPGQKEDEFNYFQAEDWVCEWMNLDGNRFQIFIPKGEYSDGVSIPRPFWSLSGIERDGLERAGAWLHDYLYNHSGIVKNLWRKNPESGKWEESTKRFNKEDSDYAIFYVLRNTPGVSLSRANLIYKMVSRYGKGKWDKHCKKNGL